LSIEDRRAIIHRCRSANYLLGSFTDVPAPAPSSPTGLMPGDPQMSDATRLFYLRIALVAIGLIFIFGVYLMGIVWPSGWVWGQGHPQHYLGMIIGVYATLGVFLLIASRHPDEHRSLIWFTVWSSVVHAVIMAAQGFSDPAEHGHLVGDVPALLLVAIVLGALMPRAKVAHAPA
jgi:hypothetical protein